MLAEIIQKVKDALYLAPSEEMVRLTTELRDGGRPGILNYGLDTLKLIDFYGNDCRRGIETARIRFVGGWQNRREVSYHIRRDTTGVRITFEGFFPYSGH